MCKTIACQMQRRQPSLGHAQVLPSAIGRHVPACAWAAERKLAGQQACLFPAVHSVVRLRKSGASKDQFRSWILPKLLADGPKCSRILTHCWINHRVHRGHGEEYTSLPTFQMEGGEEELGASLFGDGRDACCWGVGICTDEGCGHSLPDICAG